MWCKRISKKKKNEDEKNKRVEEDFLVRDKQYGEDRTSPYKELVNCFNSLVGPFSVYLSIKTKTSVYDICDSIFILKNKSQE